VSPRALEEIVRPRRLAGGGARPLNFTVRRHGRPCQAGGQRDCEVVARFGSAKPGADLHAAPSHYPDGQDVRVGDVVTFSVDRRVVVGRTGSGEYLPAFTP
jgi:hypothetical protein